jgi:hypothetical protein
MAVSAINALEIDILFSPFFAAAGRLEAVSKPQIAFENKAWSDEKAVHIR